MSPHVAALQLLVITDRTQTSRPLPDVVAAAVDGGATAILLRDKDLSRTERVLLVDLLRSRIGDALLLVASDRELDADGVHLAATDPPAPSGVGLVGRSCHDQHEVRAAVSEGVDYLTMSPVFTSSSKPSYGPTIGLAGLAGYRDCSVPVIALGGVDATNAGACLEAGASGVAVMGTVMRADDPCGVVARIRRSLDDCITDNPERRS